MLGMSVRILCALLIRSYHSPDEYWQYQEIPYYFTFGNGYLTHEWKQYPLRSPLYHLPIQAFFQLLKAFHLDYACLIAYSPRLVGALTASIYDCYLENTITLIYPKAKPIIPYLLFGFWFLNYTITRVSINSFEVTLFIMSYYYHKLSIKTTYKRHSVIFYCLLLINFLARPTSLVIYLPILCYNLLKASHSLLTTLLSFLKVNLFILLAVSCSLSLDYLYFQKPVSTAYNFLHFNLIQNGAAFYGVHSCLFYLTGFIPMQFNLYLLPILCSIYYSLKEVSLKTSKEALVPVIRSCILQVYEQFEYMLIGGFLVMILSTSAHKEDRFILPIYPLMILQLCKYIYRQTQNRQRTIRYVKYVFWINILVFVIVENTHKVGSLNALDYLRNMGDRQGNNNVLFLTPCHQTPYTSFLHKAGYTLDMLDCSPNFHRQTHEINSQTIFENNPQRYFKELTFVPHYILISEQYLDHMLTNNITLIDNFDRIKSFDHMIQVKKEYPYLRMDQLYIYLRK